MDPKTKGTLYRILWFELQHAVDGCPWVSEIAKEIMDTGLHQVGNKLLIRSGQRLRNNGVNFIIECGNTSVVRFPWVMRVRVGTGCTSRNYEKTGYSQRIYCLSCYEFYSNYWIKEMPIMLPI